MDCSQPSLGSLTNFRLERHPWTRVSTKMWNCCMQLLRPNGFPRSCLAHNLISIQTSIRSTGNADEKLIHILSAETGQRWIKFILKIGLIYKILIGWNSRLPTLRSALKLQNNAAMKMFSRNLKSRAFHNERVRGLRRRLA